MSILKRTVFVMTFFWHSAWDEKMGETLSSAEYFQPGEQMVGWCFMLLVELYLLVYPRVNSIPPIKVKHQHETNGWAWIFDFWINQLISEHVFFSNGAVHICETNPLIGRKNFWAIGRFWKIIPSSQAMMTLWRDVFLWPFSSDDVDPATQFVGVSV